MKFLYLLEDLRNPILDVFFSLITHLGSETIFLAVAIIIYWCVSKKYGYYMMTVGFLGTMMNQFLKLVCQIPRPWVRDPSFTIVESAREAATGYSFPSGHTQAVMASLGCPARFTKSKVLRWISIALILLTALSRMYLGVHTPADVGVSLLIGTILLFVLYPVFQKCDEKPIYIIAIMAGFVILSFLYLLFVELHTWPSDIDPHNLSSGVKNGYLLFGCSLGMLLSCIIEQKYIRFEEKAVWWVQLLKVGIGLLLVLALKSGLKPLLEPIFKGHISATALRYFLIVVFAACIWPMTFNWFKRFSTRQK